MFTVRLGLVSENRKSPVIEPEGKQPTDRDRCSTKQCLLKGLLSDGRSSEVGPREENRHIEISDQGEMFVARFDVFFKTRLRLESLLSDRKRI